MLWKLVKLDIKSTSRDFAILYTGMFALAILAGTMANELIVFSLALNIAISITVAVVTFVSIIRLFSRRMFSTEGYLTLTLPATSTQTVIAMVLTGAFWSIMTLVMFTLALSTMFMVVLVIEMGGLFSFCSSRLAVFTATMGSDSRFRTYKRFRLWTSDRYSHGNLTNVLLVDDSAIRYCLC
jgi:hypothetical protein